MIFRRLGVDMAFVVWCVMRARHVLRRMMFAGQFRWRRSICCRFLRKRVDQTGSTCGGCLDAGR